MRPLVAVAFLLVPALLAPAAGAPVGPSEPRRAGGQAAGHPGADAADLPGAGAAQRATLEFLDRELGEAAGDTLAEAMDGHRVRQADRRIAAPVQAGAGAAATEQAEPDARSFTVAGSGDLLIHSPVYRAAEVGDASSGEYDFASMFAEVAPVLEAADLAICHLEVPISADNSDLSGYPLFMGPLELAEGIDAAGFDACSTASNHSLDQGRAGVRSTLDALDDAGVGHAGTARTRQEAEEANLYDAGGVTVGHVSYTYGLNGLPLPETWMVALLDGDEIIASARGARDAGAEFVVASLHWGEEYRQEPTSEQRDLAEQLMEDGSVDLVLGHHAHVVQPIERIEDGVVAYGLGNFLSNQSAACCPPATQDGVIVLVEVEETAPGAFEADVRAVPTWVDREDGYRILDVVAALEAGDLAEDRREALESSRERTESVLSAGGDDHPVEVTEGRVP